MEFERTFQGAPEEAFRSLQKAAVEYERATRRPGYALHIPRYGVWGGVGDVHASYEWAEFRGQMERTEEGSRLHGRVELVRNFKIARLAVPVAVLGIYRPALFPPDPFSLVILVSLAGLVYLGFAYIPRRVPRNAAELCRWISAIR